MVDYRTTCIDKAHSRSLREHPAPIGNLPAWLWLVREPPRAPYRKHDAAGRLEGPLLDAIERERARLMQADSLLGSVAIAMKYADEESVRGPSFPSLVEMARGLVNDAINGLDSVNLCRVDMEGSGQSRAQRRLE
jgi:hypothetical protein